MEKQEARRHVERIFTAYQHRSELRAVFAAEGFFPTAAFERRQHGFYAYMKWTGRAANPFGGPLETLLFVIEGGETQHRDLIEAQKIIERSTGRINPLVAIIFGPAKNTAEICALVSERSTVHFIGTSLTEIQSVAAQHDQGIIGWIRSALYDEDLYAKSRAVSSGVDFYGRRTDVTRLAAALRRGSSHFGLFGLRKVGKTSLLLRVLNVLKNEGKSGHIVAHVDIESADGINPTTEYLLWQLGESLYNFNKVVRRSTKKFDLFGKFDALYRVPPSLPIREAFAHDMVEVFRHAQNKTVVVAVDEVQFMLGEQWGDTYLDVWRLLRALDQENPGRISFFLSGTNPTSVEAGRINGHENPTFRYISRFPVPPLNRDESTALLSGLGERMGLTWEPAAVAIAFDVTGGHPGLLRAFGSQVHSALIPRTASQAVDVAVAKTVAQGFVSVNDDTFQELDGHLRRFHPDQHVVIKALAENRLFEWAEYAQFFPEAVDVLREYGLVRSSEKGHEDIAIQAYKAWLQAEESRRATSRLPANIKDLDAGDVVAGWELVRPLGAPGGYGRVFEAKSSNGATVALKVIAGDSALRVQREVSLLSKCRHPGIVRFIASGSTGSGIAYIAMELLRGRSWDQFCSAISRLDEASMLSAAGQLLESLSSIHPVPISDDDSVDMSDIVAGQRGIIHRDIKPENIIEAEGRGPVLIDFNIASEARDRIGTVSVTPGYLPPDLAYGGSWSPSVDLYMLGLTLGQVVTGTTVDVGRVDDLKEAVRRECSGDAAAFVLKLCAARAEDRFSSARVALNDLQGLTGQSA